MRTADADTSRLPEDPAALWFLPPVWAVGAGDYVWGRATKPKRRPEASTYSPTISPRLLMFVGSVSTADRRSATAHIERAAQPGRRSVGAGAGV